MTKVAAYNERVNNCFILTVWIQIRLLRNMEHVVQWNLCKTATLKKAKNWFLVFKTNYRLMQFKSIAECSLGAFCNTFDLYLAINCY